MGPKPMSQLTHEWPSDKSFQELLHAMDKHQNPKLSVIVHMFKFNSHYRKPAQGVVSFVADLRWLSDHCEFGIFFEDMIHDSMVFGINDENIQRRLLSEIPLNFNRVLQIALDMDRAIENNIDLKSQYSRITVSGNHSEILKIEQHNNMR